MILFYSTYFWKKNSLTLEKVTFLAMALLSAHSPL